MSIPELYEGGVGTLNHPAGHVAHSTSISFVLIRNTWLRNSHD